MKFVNWITGTPEPIDDAIVSVLTPTVSDRVNTAINNYLFGLEDVYIAKFYGVDPANSGATNSTNMNALIAIVNAAGGGIIWMPRGLVRFASNWDTITANAVKVVGQGSFTGGTELRFSATSGNNITISTSGHQQIHSVYITSDVIKTSGYAIAVVGGCFRPTIRDVRMDYGFSGIYVSNCAEIMMEDITIRYMIGSRGINIGGANGDNINGCRMMNITCDNPYPVLSPTAANAKTWAITTAFNLGDVILQNGNLWQCSTAGTSAGAGTGPSAVPGTGGASCFSTVTQDGTAQWKFLGTPSWIAIDSFAYSISIETASLLNGFQGLVMRDGIASGSSYPTWAEVFNIECDHNWIAGCALNGGRGFYSSMAWVGSNLIGNGIIFNAGWGGSSQIIGARVLGNAQHGILCNSTASDTIIEGCEVALNGQQTANTYHGIAVVAGMLDFTIANNSSGLSPEGSGQQNTGILINAGASDHYNVVNNRVRGNVTAGFTDGGAGANKTVTGNIL